MGGLGADKPFSTFNNPKRESRGKLFIRRSSTWSSVFVCVCARACLYVWVHCPVFLRLLSDTRVTSGYGGIVPPRFPVQSPVCVGERVWHLPPNICPCCWTPTVARHSEVLHWQQLIWRFFSPVVSKKHCIKLYQKINSRALDIFCLPYSVGQGYFCRNNWAVCLLFELAGRSQTNEHFWMNTVSSILIFTAAQGLSANEAAEITLSCLPWWSLQTRGTSLFTNHKRL